MNDLQRQALTAMAGECFETAQSKGWHDPEIEKTPLEFHMLMVSEIAEATEAVRNGQEALFVDSDNGKPEGEAVELADCVIRIFDYCESRGFDIGKAMQLKMAYNKTRSFRHGNKLK